MSGKNFWQKIKSVAVGMIGRSAGILAGYGVLYLLGVRNNFLGLALSLLGFFLLYEVVQKFYAEPWVEKELRVTWGGNNYMHTLVSAAFFEKHIHETAREFQQAKNFLLGLSAWLMFLIPILRIGFTLGTRWDAIFSTKNPVGIVVDIAICVGLCLALVAYSSYKQLYRYLKEADKSGVLNPPPGIKEEPLRFRSPLNRTEK